LSTENEYNKLLLVGSIIGFVGAIGLIIGMIIQFNIFVSVEIFVLAMVTIALGISIVCLLTFIGGLTKEGFYVNDERPGLIALILFIFAPTSLISNQTTPLYFILGMVNDLFDTGATIGFGFYMLVIGVTLVLISFFVYAWIFLWKRRVNYQEVPDIPIIKITRIIINIIAVVSCIGIILGFILPGYSGTGTVTGLLMYEDGAHLDFEAIAFMILILGVAFTAVWSLLANFGVKFGTKSDLPLLGYLLLVLFLPGFTLKSTILNVWSNSFYEMLAFGREIFTDAGKTMVFGGWLLIIATLGLILVLFLSMITFFFGQSAQFSAKVSKRGGLEARRQKGRFPTGPPTASGGPPSADPGLGAQLSAQSGPPTGPPSASSGPPTAASFMPTAQTSAGPPAATEVPTCPFCGKQLRFIDEYQRWYCDSCSQYV